MAAQSKANPIQSNGGSVFAIFLCGRKVQAARIPTMQNGRGKKNTNRQLNSSIAPKN